MNIRRLFCLIILFYTQPCFSYYRGGYIITDLTSSDSMEFASDASLWTVSNSVCSSCSNTYTTPPNNCGIPQETILGGPNILGPSGSSTFEQYFEKDNSNLNSGDSQTALEFDLWVFYNSIPSNPSDTSFYGITADSGTSTIHSISSTLESSCELDYTDSGGVTIKAFYKFHVRVFLYHKWKDYLVMRFPSLLNVPSTVSSFGFRNFQYYLASPIPYKSTIFAGSFPCSTQKYWTGSACAACSVATDCGSCSATAPSQCTMCGIGYYDYGNIDCKAACPLPYKATTNNGYPWTCPAACPTTFFWYYNTSCTSTCPAPFVSTTDSNGFKICSNPCYYNDDTLTLVNQYRYPDSTCLSTCPSPLIKPSTGVCVSPCSDYIFQNGSCTSQCISPLVALTVNFIKYCKSPCSGQYIYLDGSCSSDCLALLVKFDESTDIKYCRTPCANINDYVFQNGSCTSQCISPLVATTVKNTKYCKSPCSGQYIYLDGSCSSDCLAPVVKFDESLDIKYCRTPCANVNDYVFPNGTCTSECPSLLVKSTARGNNFCSSACSGLYIYYDGTCLADCVTPMVQKAESTIKFCVSPCSNPQYFFYEVDQTCLPTCSDPYEPQQVYNLKVCKISGNLNLNLNVQQVQETKAMVASLTGANKAGAAGGKASASLSSTSPALAFLAGQVSMLFSIRYISVGYPDKVRLMFKLQGASPFSLSINFEIPDGIERKLGKRSPPAIFEEYEVPSNFLENSWDTLMTLILTLFSILVLSVVLRIIKGKFSVLDSILGGILSFLKWNIPLMIFCSSFGDIYFFASLQFHSGTSDSTAWEVISFILAILMMIIGLAFVIIPIKIARDVFKDQNSEKKWESFGLLYSGQKRNSIVSFCYMAYYLSVTILSNLIITNFYAYPLCEALLITAISVVMFLFLVIQRPLNELKMFAQVIINQLLLVAVNVCVVMLAIMDELEITRQDIRDKIGQGITMIFFCSMASGIAFAVIEVLFTLFYVYKFLKKFRAEQGTLSPKRIFQSLMSSGNKEKQVEEMKPKRKLDLKQRGNRPSELHRPRMDLSHVGKFGRQPPRKNPLDISYLDSNASGIDLIHQTIDYSFDLPGQQYFSPSKPQKSRLSNQQQRINMLKKNVNHRIPHQKFGYSPEILNHLPVENGTSTLQRNPIFSFPYKKKERMKGRENALKQKQKIKKQTASQSQSQPHYQAQPPLRTRKRSPSPNRSHSPNRKNQVQKEKFMM